MEEKGIKKEEEIIYELAGVKGLKSKPFRKSFKTAEARERWIEKNIDDIDELVTREVIK